jgi:2-keto-3-deoxy-L-rhamnonate aldolase RhmA
MEAPRVSTASASDGRPSPADFRGRLVAGELLVGTFVKTPHASVVEVLGHSPLDCVCLDAEHAPFDRATLDVAVLAARAGRLPALIRLQRTEPADVLSALDLGPAGIIAPHIASPEAAAALARAARYGHAGRGFSGSTRAAGFTTKSMADVIAEGNACVAVIAQVEDAEALDHIDAIAATEGIDALFIGRMDLTVSLGARSPADATVVDAVQTICRAAKRHRRTVGMFTGTAAEAVDWRREGASLFLLASDQQWILQGARDLSATLRGTR